jgi:hypothetical protein
VKGILSDVNVQGHVQFLTRILEGPAWQDVWAFLGLSLYTFRDLGLDPKVPDAILWQACQERQIVLLTANRNADGPDSLEVALRTQNQPESLPVFTFADADRILNSKEYAERVAERLLGYLIDIDCYRGVGRLCLP